MLSDTRVRKTQPNSKPIAIGGLAGLYLILGAKRGTGKYIIRFVSPETRKRKDMGLGKYPAVSIVDIRKRATAARGVVDEKIDPILAREREMSAAQARNQVSTFSDAEKSVHAEIEASFKNKKRCAQWITALETYVFPYVGEVKVDLLRPADFAKALSPIWMSKVETTSRVRQRCERVML